ncbi:MAG: hypothetical protein L0Z53_19830 [Acidobacteriales bacterium]|nr:hypothetical protein [Terriglobales bacterium]
MRNRAAAALLLALVLVPYLEATPGTFRGRIVEAPAGKEHEGWLYIQGRNRMLRRVALAGAVVVYSDQIPSQQREKDPANALSAGAEVRVTAEQDEGGEWRALRIEILKVPAGSRKVRAA